MEYLTIIVAIILSLVIGYGTHKIIQDVRGKDKTENTATIIPIYNPLWNVPWTYSGSYWGPSHYTHNGPHHLSQLPPRPPGHIPSNTRVRHH